MDTKVLYVVAVIVAALSGGYYYYSGKAKKLEEKVSSTLYDLTHLEINTIIKDEMVASKAPDSPRLILHAIATKYHGKLISLGDKYKDVLPPADEGVLNIFRGKMVFMGSGYDSFKELSDNESYRFYIGGGLYELEKRRVKSVDFYDLCEECLCDLNSKHRSTCSMNED